MSQQSVAVVGHGNIAGINLNNVGNIQNNFAGHQKGKALAMLELNVAFDALLNSKARYPAPKCHVDTRIAAQGVVTDWICGKGEWAEKGIMWISGAPGVGKSAIVQTVCETLDTDDGSKTWLTRFGFRGDRKVDGSYFFCRGVGNRDKASFFPATIAFQLSRSSSTSRDLIKKAIKAQPDILSAAFPSQFRQLLTATAKKRWPFQRPITVVIDALDECDNLDDQVELLKLILEAVTTTKMRFLIASRPEHQIHTFFQRDDVSRHTYHVRLDEETFNTSRDIEVFLRAEFARIRREKPESCPSLPNGEEWPGNVIIILLRGDSDSQFMYPRLCIDYIDTSSFSPDQQLRTLVASRPAHAFSKLDTLYHLILSRRSPDLLRAGKKALRQYQEVIMGILQIIIAWPGGPFSAKKIADILHEKVDVVQNIIRGPMRSLFKFKVDDPNSPITLCHKSLRDYLFDRDRSHEFFIPAGHADALFAELLSRNSVPGLSRSDPRELLMGVLRVVVAWPVRLKVPQIAALLDAAPSHVEGVVFGPAKALFKLDRFWSVDFSIPSFKNFLLDANRAGQYFIPGDKPWETHFTQILSRQPAPYSSLPYSEGMLKDVLNVVGALRNRLKVPEIASCLGVAPSRVESVVFGPAKAFFELDCVGNVDFSIPSFMDFLLNANRTGCYFIPRDKPWDTHFTQILSRQPPSDPSQSYSRDVLMGVLSVVVERGGWVKVPEIASFLDVAPSLVEAVVFGPAKALFTLNNPDKVSFTTSSFEDFLLDANRSGEFCVSRDKIDTHLTQILSRQSPSDLSQSYSREVLMGILKVLVVWCGRTLTVARIASTLDVDPGAVKAIVFGTAVFGIYSDGGVQLLWYALRFLQDADRAGEYYIPPNNLNPNYASMYAKIEKTR